MPSASHMLDHVHCTARPDVAEVTNQQVHALLMLATGPVGGHAGHAKFDAAIPADVKAKPLQILADVLVCIALRRRKGCRHDGLSARCVLSGTAASRDGSCKRILTVACSREQAQQGDLAVAAPPCPPASTSPPPLQVCKLCSHKIRCSPTEPWLRVTPLQVRRCPTVLLRCCATVLQMYPGRHRGCGLSWAGRAWAGRAGLCSGSGRGGGGGGDTLLQGVSAHAATKPNLCQAGGVLQPRLGHGGMSGVSGWSRPPPAQLYWGVVYPESLANPCTTCPSLRSLLMNLTSVKREFVRQ